MESSYAINDERLQSEVIGMLSVLELVDLQSVAQRLMLEVNSTIKGNKCLLLRVILRFLNSEEVEESRDGGLGMFLDLHESISRILNPPIPNSKSFSTSRLPNNSFEVSRNPFKASNNPFQHEFSRRQEEQSYFETPEVNQNQFNFTSTPKERNLIDLNSEIDVEFEPEKINPYPTENFKNLKIREFKISGSIGSPGQKDKLSYSSLAFQINNALEQGYGTSEIINAVIKAINPDNALRSYLEGRGRINIKQLLKILRSHFKEKNATSLFTLLAGLTQNEQESAQEFVIRAMSLRQKVILVSKEEDCPYSHHLVQSRFLHAVGTGLRNENVRQELKPILRKADCTDEDLLMKLNEAVSEEAEHIEKVGARKKAASVNLVAKSDQKTQPPTHLEAEIKELKARLDKLSTNSQQSSMKQNSSGNSFGGYTSNPPLSATTWYRCPNCMKIDNPDVWCHHCFKCGSADHVRADCPNQKVSFEPVTPEKN